MIIPKSSHARDSTSRLGTETHFIYHSCVPVIYIGGGHVLSCLLSLQDQPIISKCLLTFMERYPIVSAYTNIFKLNPLVQQSRRWLLICAESVIVINL